MKPICKHTVTGAMPLFFSRRRRRRRYWRRFTPSFVTVRSPVLRKLVRCLTAPLKPRNRKRKAKKNFSPSVKHMIIIVYRKAL